MNLRFRRFALAFVVVLTACRLPPPETDEEDVPVPPRPVPCKHCAAPPAETVSGRVAGWEELPGWDDDHVGAVWSAFVESCRALGRKPDWAAVCAVARMLPDTPSDQDARQFFEQNFTPRQVVADDGSTQGLVTGYYEPLIRGSRTWQPDARWPVLAPPDDLRERKPYWTRGELEQRRLAGKLPARVLFWANDPIDLFFLQVQGSGQIELPDGSRVRVGFAEHNGHSYRSIGRWLVDQGELAAHQASMEGIRQWAQRNPQRLDDLLNSNPRYVFFRELPMEAGVVGALGVPLHAGRSIAVDPNRIPLGVPVFLATTWPSSDEPLNRLVMAQDTGSAIKGAVRADFFWGFGPDAGEQAGKMRQQGRIWVLRPRKE